MPYLNPFSRKIYVAFAIVTLIITALYAPLHNVNKGILNEKRRWKKKVISILTTLIWLIILLVYIKNEQIFVCGMSTIILQSFQLIKLKECFINGKII
jgi:Accessory gene regulator B.